VLLAYFIELDGDVHLPMYEKFETELAELKAKDAIKHRARRRLESYLNEGRLESNSLKIFELQFERRTLAVFRIVSVMAHEAIDQTILGLGCDKPILEAVPERIDRVLFCGTQSVFV
jgi:hypothetical protein